METASDPYEDAALVYIRLVQKESQEAANAVEHIHAVWGAHAALRVALILVVMKMEVQENHWVPGIGLYMHLLNDYPEVLPLMTYAMRCCLEHWAVPTVEAAEWVGTKTTSE